MVYFHGTPGAPEECAVFDRYGKENGLSFICYERFSVDSSLEIDACYRYLAEEISRKAGGKPVDFVGFSMGGFIALMVTRFMSDGVRHLHLISAAAPLQAGNFLEIAAGKTIFRLAQAHPYAFRLVCRLQGLIAATAPGLLFRAMFANATGEDKALLNCGKFRTDITGLLQSCLTNHAPQYAREISAYVGRWAGSLSAMETNTHIWHGAEDNWSPPAMALYLQAAIPGCTSIEIFDGLSHYSCLHRAAPEICRQLGVDYVR